MCGRFTVTRSLREIHDRFEFPDEDAQKAADLFSPNYNIAPTDPVPVIYHDGNHFRLEIMRWGLLPPWTKNERAGPPLINARDDTLAEKPAFRDGLATQRCLIVADSFYEWQTVGKSKRPFRFLMSDARLFAFAGLYARWLRPDTGASVPSCTIITTQPNALVERIHNRMPVILPRASESNWLDPVLQSYDDIKSFLRPLDEGLMKQYPVSPAVNSVKNKGSHLIDPVESDDLFGDP